MAKLNIGDKVMIDGKVRTVVGEPQRGVKIIKTKSGKFRVKYYAANGEMLAHSELLNSKQAANKNVKAMGKLFAVVPVIPNMDQSYIDNRKLHPKLHVTNW